MEVVPSMSAVLFKRKTYSVKEYYITHYVRTTTIAGILQALNACTMHVRWRLGLGLNVIHFGTVTPKWRSSTKSCRYAFVVRWNQGNQINVKARQNARLANCIRATNYCCQ